MHPFASADRAVAPTPAGDDGALVADLLHATPALRVDREATLVAVALAFAGGVSGGLFTDALRSATYAPSTWDPACFAKDLFLPTFVSVAFKVRIGQQEPPIATQTLVDLLAHPPADPATVHHRRAIARELVATPALRQALEDLYTKLCRFRGLLEGATGVGKWDAARRRLEILGTFRDIVEAMAARFAGAQSGLARLAAYGRRVQGGEPYRSLVDLLRYDERLATVSVKIGVGADGRIRGLELVALEEYAANPFVLSPLRRWLAKLELFVRGYDFSDGEVLARLIDAVFDGVAADVVPLVQLVSDLEFYLGALGFRDTAMAAGLDVCLPDIVPPEAPRHLVDLFNPLLLGHGVKPVPCTIATDRHDTTTLVTGPNSGGKTRLLQSLALTQLLGQAGLFVPARSARIALAPGLVVSLIEETRADQSEGRLGTELVRIRELFERLEPGAMVVLDELCSGTNPSEGEEIFELVVRMLGRLAPQAFITTHFLAFAKRLERERGVAALRFLQVELGPGQKPTYQFVPGVAATSLAAHAAARLGVTGEQLSALVDRRLQGRGGPRLVG